MDLPIQMLTIGSTEGRTGRISTAQRHEATEHVADTISMSGDDDGESTTPTAGTTAAVASSDQARLCAWATRRQEPGADALGIHAGDGLPGDRPCAAKLCRL